VVNAVGVDWWMREWADLFRVIRKAEKHGRYRRERGVLGVPNR
jgi:hypothetical protein